MSPDNLEAYLQNQCRVEADSGRLIDVGSNRPVTAVIPVHLYGQMADMDSILAIARRYNLIVVEDACQAHGAEYYSREQQRWCRAGSMGDAAAFSFYPGKNLGACGEAGAITTNAEAIAKRCRILRDHGQTKKYFHEVEGYNGRLDAIQAGFLKVKVRHLESWNEERRQRAREYDRLFDGPLSTVRAPEVPSWSKHVYHLYVVRVEDREALQADLSAAGISTGIHYPVALHLLPAYAHLGLRVGAFPIAERACAEVLSLPMFPTLAQSSQQRVAAELLRLTARRRSDAPVNT
jgi:dTDP-4-amino-4,6-dideoxygalactose transaminase